MNEIYHCTCDDPLPDYKTAYSSKNNIVKGFRCIRCERLFITPKDFSTDVGIERATAQKEESDMKLELGIMAGAESKAFLVDLTKQIDRLEKLYGGKKTAVEADDEETETEVEAAADSDDDEDFTPVKKTKAKAAKSFDDDEDDAEEEEVKPAKKAKKITLDDVNDACKARAAGGRRKEVLAILKKKFKTESVSTLEPEQYPALIAAMKD